tara:strand:+ start:75 stop:1361 length:1287 start_codon:yes stop_codon:yes gene_type:complete
MTTKAGFYGSDAKQNRFRVPELKGTRSQNEAYFVLVNKETGKSMVYNEEAVADKVVGEYDDKGKFVPNEAWWGGAQPEEREFFSSDKGKELVNGHAKTIAENGIREEQGLDSDPESATKKANELVNANDAKEEVKLSESVNKLRSEPADKNTRNQFPKLLFYPITLRQESPIQDVIKFSMMKYEPKDVPQGLTFKDRDQSRRTIGSCILPIPGGISDGNQVSWNQDNMDPVAIAKAEVALKTIKDGGEGFTGSISDIAGALGGTGKDTIATLIAQAAAGGGSLLTRTTGSVLNPNMELLFQGPSLRDFSFQFKLSPRSSKEAKQIIKIIRFFKQGMAPIRSQSRLFLKSPHTFKLQYLHDNDDHKYLNRFKECALQSCTVTYGEAQYSTYEDGVLSSYNMNLSFKELEPVFNDEYSTLDGNNDSMIGY